MTMETDIEHLEHCSQNVMKYANGEAASAVFLRRPSFHRLAKRFTPNSWHGTRVFSLLAT